MCYEREACKKLWTSLAAYGKSMNYHNTSLLLMHLLRFLETRNRFFNKRAGSVRTLALLDARLIAVIRAQAPDLIERRIIAT